MRIGIITFHRSINYGAFMQCYSLSHQLEKDFPDCEVEVIDYTSEVFETLYSTSFIPYLLGTGNKKNNLKTVVAKTVKLIMNPHELKNLEILKQAFSKDLQYLKLSEKIPNENMQKAFDTFVNNYDVIIVGSDGVWEYISYPFPNIYYLGDDRIPAKFSYAASSDRMYYPDITEYQKEYIDKSLSSFKFIGIRDIATQNFIENINPKLNYYHTCDPTIFLDLNGIDSSLERIKKELTDNGIDLDRPIIGIMGDNNIGKLIRQIFGKKYQVISIYTNTKYADYYLNDLRPTEWAKVFSLFSITFTRYFHGTILSLKNGTPTITLDPWKSRDEDHITKIDDLYRRLDLREHYFKKKVTYSKEDIDVIRKTAEKFIEKPDKKKIFNALDKEGSYYNIFRLALNKYIDDIEKG